MIRLIWQVPNRKIVFFVDVCGYVKPNYEIQSLNQFKENMLNP